MLEGVFLCVLDAVDGLLATDIAEFASLGEVLHEGGHVEDNVLTIHPSADTQGVVRHPSVFVGGMPRLLESPLELLPQDLRVLGVVKGTNNTYGMEHGDTDLRDTAPDSVTPTGTPRVGRHLVVVQGSCLERVAWVAWCEQDCVPAVSEGATEGFGDEVEVGVFVGLHACVYWTGMK